MNDGRTVVQGILHMMSLPHAVSWGRCGCLWLQATLEANEQKSTDLEAKLKYEREKHQSYDRDSKEREKKFQAVEKQHQVGGVGTGARFSAKVAWSEKHQDILGSQ